MRIDFTKPFKTCQGGDCTYLGRSSDPNETHPHIIRMADGKIGLYNDLGVCKGKEKRGLFQEGVVFEHSTSAARLGVIERRLAELTEKIDRLLIALGEEPKPLNGSNALMRQQQEGMKS